MNLDFSSILIVASVVAGTIVLADLVISKVKARSGVAGNSVSGPWLVVQARAFLPVLIVVLLIRSFVFEPFRIPSASMMPGLVDGDFIVVSKFSYGLRLPVMNSKFLSTWEPQRGDVIVFRLPADPSVNYIKRLIGEPGDHVVVRNNRVTINGALVPLEPAGVYQDEYGFDGAGLALEHFDAGSHRLMIAADRPATDFDGIVPAGQYFFMGDNRNDSRDGRFPAVGYVPDKNLVGHAVRIWMNFQWPHLPKWRRFGLKIN